MKANTVKLEPDDRAMLSGEAGPAAALAMRLNMGLGEAVGADGLVDIASAHTDSCLFHGAASLDFAQRLVDGQARVVVPTTLNVGSLDLLHPELVRLDADTTVAARRLMELYEAMGCQPTWTCAPYQLEPRPGFGDHVAWAESNAIVFANSALGARTARYGDFIDIAAAITGRVPAAGLHLDEHRLGQVVIEVGAIRPELADHDMLFPVLGYLVGEIAGTRVAVVDGLEPNQPEHRLKALFAAAASSGAVAMVHVVASTPEAPDRTTATGGEAVAVERVDADRLSEARARLGSGREVRLAGVSLGTPHYSVDEFARLVELLAGRSTAPGIGFWVNTSRAVLNEIGLRGWAAALEAAGVTIVVDTCTYITPIIGRSHRVAGVVMTDSAKWAHYAPANIGVDAMIASLDDCVESAIAGRVVSVTDHLWTAP